MTLSLNTVSRGENSVKLWNASKLNSPVYTFFGHRDVVTEFCWQNCDQEGGRDKYNVSEPPWSRVPPRVRVPGCVFHGHCSW